MAEPSSAARLVLTAFDQEIMKKELILYIPEDLYWQVVIAAAKHQQDPETWIIGVLEGMSKEQEDKDNE